MSTPIGGRQVSNAEGTSVTLRQPSCPWMIFTAAKW